MADATVTYDEGKPYQEDLAQLQTNATRPRMILDYQSWDELAASITKYCFLEPIFFRIEIVSFSQLGNARPSYESVE